MCRNGVCVRVCALQVTTKGKWTLMLSWPSVFLQKTKVPCYKRKEYLRFGDLFLVFVCVCVLFLKHAACLWGSLFTFCLWFFLVWYSSFCLVLFPFFEISLRFWFFLSFLCLRILFRFVYNSSSHLSLGTLFCLFLYSIYILVFFCFTSLVFLFSSSALFSIYLSFTSTSV